MSWVDRALLDDIDAFRARHGMTPSRFGRAFRGQANFIDTLLAGRSIGQKMREDVYEWMAAKDAELTAASREDAA